MPGLHKSMATKTGNLSKAERDRAEQAEMSLKDSLDEIKPPTWLKGNLKKRFNWYVKQMERINILSILDGNILAQYVYYEARFLELDQLIQATGMTTEEGKVNPLLVEQRQVRTLMDKMESKLGFNPTDRLRFVKVEEIQEDPLEAFKNEL